jgi:hypothetical protein
MPSRKPRLHLTVEPELRAALEDLGAALGKPPATVAVEILRESIPTLQELTKYARAMQAGNKAAAKRAMTHMVGNALAEQLELLLPRGS